MIFDYIEAMDKKKVISYFNAFTTNAKDLLKDKGQTINKLKEAFKKANFHKDSLDTIWDKLHMLLSLAGDYSQGRYTAIPKRSIIAIIGALLYFLSPLDFIPDFIFGLGFIDDVYVITLVYKQVIKDLEAYSLWKNGSAKLIHIE
ncbi:MAG: YkvA family protein [Bacteroidia bacterium]